MIKTRTLSINFWLLSTLLCMLLNISCSKYEKLLKSRDNEVKYQAAMKYYSKKKYSKAIPLFDAVGMAYRGTPRDDTTAFYLANSYYLDSDPYTAEYYFGIFKNTFPRSPFAEEAAFKQGVCLYKASYRPDLDPTPINKALLVFDEFNYSFPKSDRKVEVTAMTEELVGRLMKKSFQAGRFYYNVDEYRSAIVTLKNCLKDYPDTPYREEILYYILRSNYLYASNSVASKQKERYQSTIDEYYNFISEYPQSKYAKDAKNMYYKAMNITDKDKLQIVDKEATEVKETK